MSEHEVKKIGLSDVTANRRRGGDIRVLLSPRTVGASAGFFGILTLQPGESVTEHRHPYSEEFLYVIAGSATARLEGSRLVELSAGEGLLVPTDMRHRVANSGQDVATIAFTLAPLAPRPELGHVDTEEPAAPEQPQPSVGAAR